MPNYELTYILRPLEEAALAAVSERIAALVQTNGGEIVAREDWGRRRLAYPIRKHLEGHYTTLYLTLPAQAVRLVERGLQLNEDVLRYLIVRVETHTRLQMESKAEVAASVAPPSSEPKEATAETNATATALPPSQPSSVPERS